jgi:hypothetical protein
MVLLLLLRRRQDGRGDLSRLPRDLKFSHIDRVIGRQHPARGVVDAPVDEGSKHGADTRAATCRGCFVPGPHRLRPRLGSNRRRRRSSRLPVHSLL